jgi:hypothetical protein
MAQRTPTEHSRSRKHTRGHGPVAGLVLGSFVLVGSDSVLASSELVPLVEPVVKPARFSWG